MVSPFLRCWSTMRSASASCTPPYQTCLAHLLRRCREMVQAAGGRGAQFPRAVQTLLPSALDLRDRRDQGQGRQVGTAQ